MSRYLLDTLLIFSISALGLWLVLTINDKVTFVFPQEVDKYRNPIGSHEDYCVASSFYNEKKRFYGTDFSRIITVYEYTHSIVSCVDVSVDAGTCFVQKGAPWTLQCLPTFVIIGAMKAATGAMMSYLNLHPELISGRRILPYGKLRNEVHYFDECSSENNCHWIDYIRFFPKQNIRAFSSIKMTFEKTPSYITSKIFLESMHQMLPSLRVIVLLRNPVDRAISGFCHNCRHRRYISFYEHGRLFLANSLYLNQSTLSHFVTRHVRAECKVKDLSRYYDRRSPHCLLELSVGHYFDQVTDLLDVFETDRILILFQERMAENTPTVIKMVENWLSIPHLIKIPKLRSDTFISYSRIIFGNDEYMKAIYCSLQYLSYCGFRSYLLGESYSICYGRSEYICHFSRTNCHNISRENFIRRYEKFAKTFRHLHQQ